MVKIPTAIPLSSDNRLLVRLPYERSREATSYTQPYK